jgi:hypothetical protein
LALLTYIGICAIKLLKSARNLKASTLFIIIAWVGYQAQSLISINQIGLGIWGWVLGGAIIGLHVSSITPVGLTIDKKSRFSSKKNNSISSSSGKIGFLIGLTVSLLLVCPPFFADHNYRNAAASRDGNRVLIAAKAKPVDLYRVSDAINGFSSSNLKDPAIGLAKFGIKENPRYYTTWAFLKQLSVPGSPDYQLAIKRMKELNPQSNDIK